MIEAEGARQTDTTEGPEGRYEFKRPPKAGPYMLVFRNQNAIAFHEVKQLTVGDRQAVSVTIDPLAKTFQSAYNSVQASEALAAFGASFPAALPALTSDLKSLSDALGSLQNQIAALGLPPGQVNFLKTKADNILVLVRSLFNV